jgi:hypothetical protein
LAETQSLGIKIEAETETELTEKEIKFLCDRDWYKDNCTISSCIAQIKHKNEDDYKYINISTELISLYKKNLKKYNTEIEKCEKNIRIKKTSIRRREKIRNFMENCTTKEITRVKEFFNFV